MTREIAKDRLSFREGEVLHEVITSDALAETIVPPNDVRTAKQPSEVVNGLVRNYTWHGVAINTESKTVCFRFAVYFPPCKGRKPEDVGWVLHLLTKPATRELTLPEAVLARSAVDEMAALANLAGAPNGDNQLITQFSKILDGMCQDQGIPKDPHADLFFGQGKFPYPNLLS